MCTCGPEVGDLQLGHFIWRGCDGYVKSLWNSKCVQNLNLKTCTAVTTEEASACVYRVGIRDNIIIDLRYILLKHVSWIHLAEDGLQGEVFFWGGGAVRDNLLISEVTVSPLPWVIRTVLHVFFATCILCVSLTVCLKWNDCPRKVNAQ
jgi:hypothetical protein